MFEMIVIHHFNWFWKDINRTIFHCHMRSPLTLLSFLLCISWQLMQLFHANVYLLFSSSSFLHTPLYSLDYVHFERVAAAAATVERMKLKMKVQTHSIIISICCTAVTYHLEHFHFIHYTFVCLLCLKEGIKKDDLWTLLVR